MRNNLTPRQNKKNNKNNNDHVTIQIADFYSRFVQDDQLFDSAALRSNIADLVQVEKQHNFILGVEQVRALETTRRDAGIGVSGVLALFDIQGNLVVNLAHSTSHVVGKEESEVWMLPSAFSTVGPADLQRQLLSQINVMLPSGAHMQPDQISKSSISISHEGDSSIELWVGLIEEDQRLQILSHTGNEPISSHTRPPTATNVSALAQMSVSFLRKAHSNFTSKGETLLGYGFEEAQSGLIDSVLQQLQIFLDSAQPPIYKPWDDTKYVFEVSVPQDTTLEDVILGLHRHVTGSIFS
jgi:hypothetical protein